MFEGILQSAHLILILLVALVVFGPKRLPEIGKGLGEAIRGFKNSLDEATSASTNPNGDAKKSTEKSPNE